MSWDDGKHSKVKKVQLTFDDVIKSIEVEYDGASVKSQPRGAVGSKSDAFTLSPDEYITEVTGYYRTVFSGDIITALTFKTNKKTYGTYGSKTSSYFSLNAPKGSQIAGFKGSSTNALNSIDAHFAPVPPPGSTGGAGSNPGGASSNPGGAGSNPEGAGSKPGGAGSNPGGAGSNPGGAGSNPGGAGSNPGGAGSNPGGAGFNPGGAGSNPGSDGSNPGGTGSNPGGAGSNPGGAGSNSGGADSSSGGAGSNPGGAGSNPGGAGSNPGGAGSNPEGAGTNPEGAGSNPGGAGSNLGGPGSNPGSAGSNPGGAGSDPGGNTGSSPQKFEAQGGKGGNQWDDGADHDGVTKIHIAGGGLGIEQIKFDYVKNGQAKEGPAHGVKGGRTQIVTMEINHPDEYLISVEGWSDSSNVIQGIKFQTNKTTSQYFGWEYSGDGTQFSLQVEDKKIIGFHGFAGSQLNSLGAYFIPTTTSTTPLIPPKKLQAIGGDGGDSWDDGVFDGVKKISVGQGNDGVVFVKFEYNKGSQVITGEGHGKQTLLGTETFELEYPSEYITSVEVYYDKIFGAKAEIVTSLTFKTNKRTSPPFGLSAGERFELKEEGYKIVGFHGKAGDLLHQIGVYVVPITTN